LDHDLEHHSALEHFGFEVSGAHLSDRVKHGTHHKLSVDFTNMPKRAAVLFFSPPAALRSSEAVRSSRVIDTAAPIDAAPLKSQHRVRVSLIWESNESQFRAAG
jgi:hypothetical protein